MKTLWLWHPDDPGTRILVVRGFWAQLLNPKSFATHKEALLYSAFMGGLRRRRMGDE